MTTENQAIKVLVIDDEEIIRERMKQLLEIEDYHAFTAEDGIKGVKAFNEVKPDIILLDIRMPGMDGIEALKEIKKQKTLTEVIMMTGHGGIEHAIEALNNDAFGYLQKPVDFDEVEITIKKAVSKQQMQIRLDESIIKTQEALADATRLNQELKAAQEQILRSEKVAATGKLAAGISNEFNNLMTGILGNAVLLEKEFEADSKPHQKLKAVSQCAQRAADLTQQLLAFARTGTGEKKMIDVNRVVSRAIDHLQSTCNHENIRGHRELGEGLMAVEGDHILLMQALTALAKNACDAMPEGGGVYFKTENFAFEEGNAFNIKAGRYACISIRDEGKGIAADIKDKIFDPFFTTKQTREATGLGLSVVYNIIQNHEGHILFESVEGQGSVFKVYLPAVD
ncbi:MAG: response regulator [Deltaproteobacteria bacterium]|nr:response regulator [Deltaproteobacteria bacterium]